MQVKKKTTKKENVNQQKENVNQQISFAGENVYVGIDVHKDEWVFTVVYAGVVAHKDRIGPNPVELKKILMREFPEATYYSVYEAGFSGFWAHRELIKLGINNIVVNPADIPTRSKERRRKTDRVDATKLARELSVGHLQGIYVPSKEAESFRDIVRLRRQLVTDQTRIKNRIKAKLMTKGLKVDDDISQKHWSKKYIEALRNLEISYPKTKATINGLLDYLEAIKSNLASRTREIREFVQENEQIKETVELLQSVPGVGFILATALYSEIIDINRFNNFDQFASYVGLAPAVRSSGEKEYTLGLSKQRNKYIRNLLIEAAWVAIRKDHAFQISYGKLMARKMPQQKVIIKMAKKLLRRIYSVWKNKKPYIYSVVEK